MTKFKGTKGKWYACCLKDKPHFIFGDKSGLTICKPFMEQEDGDDLTLEEYRANALLISKAPEMLQVLEEALILRKEIEYSGEKRDPLSIEVLALGGLMQKIEKIVKEATEI